MSIYSQRLPVILLLVDFFTLFAILLQDITKDSSGGNTIRMLPWDEHLSRLWHAPKAFCNVSNLTMWSQLNL